MYVEIGLPYYIETIVSGRYLSNVTFSWPKCLLFIGILLCLWHYTHTRAERGREGERGRERERGREQIYITLHLYRFAAENSQLIFIYLQGVRKCRNCRFTPFCLLCICGSKWRTSLEQKE